MGRKGGKEGVYGDRDGGQQGDEMRLQAAVDEQGTFKEKLAMRSQITASLLLGRFDAGLPEPVKGVGCDEVDGRCRSEEEE